MCKDIERYLHTLRHWDPKVPTGGAEVSLPGSTGPGAEEGDEDDG